MENKALIKKAAAVVRSRKTKDGLLGDVGCALLSGRNNVYQGVCASVGSNVFCAEQNAMGSMITNGEFRIKKIVAVWKDAQGKAFVIPPCGNCRQLMVEIDEGNVNADIVLDRNRTKKLVALLPYHGWWKKQRT